MHYRQNILILNEHLYHSVFLYSDVFKNKNFSFICLLMFVLNLNKLKLSFIILLLFIYGYIITSLLFFLIMGFSMDIFYFHSFKSSNNIHIYQTKHLISLLSVTVSHAVYGRKNKASILNPPLLKLYHLSFMPNNLIFLFKRHYISLLSNE